MAIIGGIMGGTIAIYILSFLWEWLVFKRVFDDPVAGKLTSVGVALLMATLLAGYGMAPRGIFAWWASIYYIPGAALLAFLGYCRGLKLREAMWEETTTNSGGLEETFR